MTSLGPAFDSCVDRSDREEIDVGMADDERALPNEFQGWTRTAKMCTFSLLDRLKYTRTRIILIRLIDPVLLASYSLAKLAFRWQ